MSDERDSPALKSNPDDGEGTIEDLEQSAHYKALVKELQEKGAILDSSEVVSGNFRLLENPVTRAAAIHKIAEIDEPIVSRAYDKDAFKILLLDSMARTIFDSDEEFLAFLDLVEWDEDFGVPLDYCIMYLVAKPSVGGVSRRQLIDALSSFTQRTYNYGNKNATTKNKARRGELS